MGVSKELDPYLKELVKRLQEGDKLDRIRAKEIMEKKTWVGYNGELSAPFHASGNGSKRA